MSHEEVPKVGEHVAAERGRFECRGPQGETLVPGALVYGALMLPSHLEAELGKDMSLVDATLQQDMIADMENIENHYRRAYKLKRQRGGLMEAQRDIQSQLKSDLEVRDGALRNPINRLRLAAVDIAPGEISYFQALVDEGIEITEAHHAMAGQIDPSSRLAKALGRAPRLIEETPHNYRELVRVTLSDDEISFVEGQADAGSVLSISLAFGDRKQVAASLSLFERLRKLACDENTNTPNQVRKQAELSAEIVRLVGSVDSPRIDPVTQQRIDTRLQSFMENVDWRVNREEALINTMVGRKYRMRGNKYDTPETPAEPIAEQSAKPAPKAEAPKPEPRPDHLGAYRGKLQEVVASANFKRFEELTTKETKRRELDEARGILVKGEYDGDGNLLVGGRSKAEAQRYVSAVEFLRSFIAEAGSAEAGKDALDAAVEASTEYETRLFTMVTEAGVDLTDKELTTLRNQIPDIAVLDEVVSYIRDDWSTAEYVIANHWPGNGKAIAEQLRQLLFMDKEEIGKAAVQAAEAAAQAREQAEAEAQARAEEARRLAEEAALEIATRPDPEPELKPEPQEGEIVIEKIEDMNALDAIAEQLNEIILPAHATEDDVKRAIEETGLSDEHAAQIDWTRLYNLVKLREASQGVMYRSKEGDLGNAPPYFVVAINFKGSIYAVAESPVEGNATYIIAEKDCPGTWLEVLQLDKASARELGAKRIIHREGRTSPDHLVKIQDALIDMVTTAEPVETRSQ